MGYSHGVAKESDMTKHTHTQQIKKEIYYKELAHMAVEVEKSQNLPSPTWTPQRIGSVISNSQGLRTRRASV